MGTKTLHFIIRRRHYMLQIVNTINSYLSDYILVFLFGGCRPLVYSQNKMCSEVPLERFKTAVWRFFTARRFTGRRNEFIPGGCNCNRGTGRHREYCRFSRSDSCGWTWSYFLDVDNCISRHGYHLCRSNTGAEDTCYRCRGQYSGRTGVLYPDSL